MQRISQTAARGLVHQAFFNVVVTTSSRAAATITADRISGADTSVLAKAKPFEDIPGYRIFPLIGSAWIYFPVFGKYNNLKLHHADMDKYLKFGPIYREKIGHFNLVTCLYPEDIEMVLRHEGKYPNRGELSSLKAYRELRKEWYKTPGIIILQGKEWHNLRSKSQPFVMKPKLVQAYLDSMHVVSKDLVKKILHLRNENNEVPNILPELYNWALENIAFVCLDTRFGCLNEEKLDPNSESARMINAVQNIFLYMNKLEAFTGNVQWWKYLPSPTWKKFVQVADYFTEIAIKYINLSLEELKKNNKEGKDLTLLQSLLSTSGLDMSGVMTTIMDLLFGGIDTTSHTEAFLLYHLAKNPEKQEKLRQEVVKVLSSSGGKLTPAAVNELRYMKACMKESIRLSPIIRGLARNLDHDIVLSGHRVPAGTNIFCALQVASRLEKNYKNADEFIPERWLDKENKPHPYLSIPFGIGMRSCIGRRLAEQEMLCGTAEIIKHFRVEHDGEDIDMHTRMISIPNKPLKLKFINHM